jgi:hypothetical protein
MRTFVIEEHRLLFHRRLCEKLFQRKADAEALVNLSRSHLGSERICAKLENVVCDADVIALDDLQPNCQQYLLGGLGRRHPSGRQLFRQ